LGPNAGRHAPHRQDQQAHAARRRQRCQEPFLDELASFCGKRFLTPFPGHLVYSAFGQVLDETPGGPQLPFAFTGRELDRETDLYYYRARYYDAAVGKFISDDPIGFRAGDANLSRYVGNAATTATDPTGLLVWPWDERADRNVLNNLSALAGTVESAVVRVDQFGGQVGTYVITGDWVDPDCTSGLGMVGSGFAGAGRGAKNIAVGTVETGEEIGLMGADLVKDVGEAVGVELYRGYKSKTGRALQYGQVDYDTYYVEFTANVITFGAYEQGKAGYECLTGEITLDEAGKRIGTTGRS